MMSTRICLKEHHVRIYNTYLMVSYSCMENNIFVDQLPTTYNFYASLMKENVDFLEFYIALIAHTRIEYIVRRRSEVKDIGGDHEYPKIMLAAVGYVRLPTWAIQAFKTKIIIYTIIISDNMILY